MYKYTEGGNYMPIPNYNAKARLIPSNMQQIYDKYSEWSAWYSGDPQKLLDVYANRIETSVPNGSFWANDYRREKATTLHVPIAGDIASTSADLLFGEPPRIYIPEAHGEGASKEAIKAQERLEEIIYGGGLFSKLIEAGESASALGGVYLKPVWDLDLAPYPLVSVAQADSAIPEFRFGVLVAVTFWRELTSLDGKHYYRHFERHEKGHIFNALFKSEHCDTIGYRLPLESHPETRGMLDEYSTGLDYLDVFYIPNKTPNRLFRGSNLGQSDLSGVENLMDALDEAYTSLMRDIRLGQARIIVPETWLERTMSREGGGALGFNPYREVFTAIGADPVSSENAGITLSQFEIRTEQHLNTTRDLIERIVSSAGYAPQSFGLQIEGLSQSGTALNIRERKTYITKSKKEEHFRRGLIGITKCLLDIDAKILKSGITPFTPKVEFQDGVQVDLITLSNSVNLLNTAQAVSTYTKVKMVNPEWTTEQVEQEVARILDEQGISLPDPTL